MSTETYDSNDFIMGMSTEKWASLNEDENIPLMNRFRQAWCPGSTFKAVIAAIGLETGAVDPTADLGNDGARWQKDRSWGGYHVTTLHPASPANLRNALLVSMTEDVKGRGGSGYVVKKDKRILEFWFGGSGT